MRYAVVQKTLDPLPTIDQLKKAFHGIPGLTSADAYILGKDAFGILVKGFSLECANMLQSSLAGQGLESEVIDEAVLPVLPQGKNVSQLACTPEALLIYDPLNRSFPLEWKNIMMIAAGKVPLTEFSKVRNEVEVSTPQVNLFTGGVHMERRTEVQYSSREQRADRLLLEIILTRAVLRYTIAADKSPLLFNYLGERRTRDVNRDFALLVQDLIKFAPQAAINRGAYYLREDAAQPFVYPSRNAFYEEITWLLWKIPPGSTTQA